ncbi:MAG: ribonuclease Z [Deltaproteobacteria bacterium SG8_13]|nr:MAG: ribonuclease Z [Deltaproteobacteria bacterium SG8_13]
MRPSFVPRLVNGPFDDPALFIPFLFQHRAVIFDLGDLAALSSRDVLKTTHVFVTHTHMDHFVGFDRLLRLFLGREQTLSLYGPEGFLKNVEGKLAGYSWDLVHNYDTRLTLKVTEVHPEQLLQRSYRCERSFAPDGSHLVEPWQSDLVKEPAMTVSAVVLDHSTACLGFKISESFHVNIRAERLSANGLRPGPWLQHFKEALYRRKPAETSIEAEKIDGGRTRFRLGDLQDDVAVITAGQTVCYITDVSFTASNVASIIAFASGADHLFIEAAFLEADRQIAKAKNHLTARQAGEIAGMSKVKLLTAFHFSPRYQGQAHLLEAEAQNAYREALRANRPD